MRKLLAYPGIYCYMLCLGTNDVRHKYDRKLEDDVMDVLRFLIERTQGKVIISLPKRTRKNCIMNERLSNFRERTKKYIYDLKNRLEKSKSVRLLINSNDRFDDVDIIAKIDTVFLDNIHLNEKGTAILAYQMKKALHAVFGIKLTSTRTNPIRV